MYRFINRFFTLIVLSLTYFCLLHCLAFAQAQKIDSLSSLLPLALKDSSGVRILLELSKLYDANGQAEKQLLTLMNAEKQSQALPPSQLRYDVLMENASALQDRGMYAETIEAAFKALAIAEALGDSVDIAWANMRLGSCYAELRQVSVSLHHHEITLEIARKFQNTLLIAQAHASRAWAFELGGDLRHATTSLDTSLALRRTLQNEVLVGRSLLGLARVLSKQGLYAKARPLAEESLKKLKGAGGEHGNEAEILALLGWIYFQSGQRKQGLVYADSALKYSQHYAVQYQQPYILKTLAEMHVQMQQFQQSSQFYQHYAAVKDSIFSGKMLQTITALETAREAAKNEQEIAAQRLNVRIIAVGMVMSMIVGLIIWLLYSRQRRSNTQIRKQKETLEQQAVEIQRANTVLYEQNEKLTSLNREKNELMGIVAHDLKNPIGAVRGLAELLHHGLIDGKQVPGIMGQIVITADRMLELVKNLLDVNQLESGGMRFHFVTFDVVPIVDSAVVQYQAQAEAKNITLHFSAEDPPNLVFADEQALMQVLDNLLSNAVKYSPHGKQVFVRVLRNTAAVRVEIQDQGEGISPDDMTKLFGKFARLSARPTGGEHSTGLGLSIVKKMVEAMNGKVWCESELGKGATFIVELPSQHA